MLVCRPRRRTILVCVCGWHKTGWEETKHWSDVESTCERSRFGWTNVLPWPRLFWLRSTRMRNEQRHCGQLQKYVWIQDLCRSKGKLPCSGKPDADISSWFYDMESHAKKCVERCCALANKPTQQLYKVTTPCLDDHQFKEAEIGSVGEPSKVCSQIVLKCLHLARIWRHDIFCGLWTNLLVTTWTKARDKQ